MKYAIIILMASLLLLAGCTQSIAQIKNETHIGKTVAVAGTVESTIKIGKLSGYTLVDNNGDKIGVSAETLPREGTKVTVTGTLIKDTIFGYYIKA